MKECGELLFLSDTAALCPGSRLNAVDYRATAVLHGFDYAAAKAPVIRDDRSLAEGCVKCGLTKTISQNRHYCRDIVTVDNFIVLTHFKGHNVSESTGAIKIL